MDKWYNFFPVAMILAALLGLFLFNNWRRQVISLVALYLGMFILLVQVNPFTLAAVKLISGWMSALLLGLIIPKEKVPPAEGLLSNQIFRVFCSIFIWVIAYLISKSVGDIFSVNSLVVFISLAIFGSGLLQLGMKVDPLQVVLGILTVFAGFELLYTSIESSVLINGLLAAMNLLIALLGTFFNSRDNPEENA